MLGFRNKKSVFSKCIIAVFIWIFLFDTIAAAVSIDTLSPPVGEYGTYAEMLGEMQRRYDSHNETIDKFIIDHTKMLYSICKPIRLDSDLRKERVIIRRALENALEDSGASDILEKLEGGKVGIVIQLLVLENEEELPCFEGEQVRGHASDSYITIFVRKNELNETQMIVAKIFHEIRARSHREDQPIGEFERVNREIEEQVREHGKITDPALRAEFANLTFPEELSIIHRDYAVKKRKKKKKKRGARSRGRWSDDRPEAFPPEVFEHFDSVRRYYRPVMEKLIAERVMPLLGQEGSVLEVGAGVGELRNMVGDMLPSGIEWIETDPSQRLLDEPRQYETTKRVVTLPDISYPSEPVSAVAGYGVLDVIPHDKLSDVFKAIARVLKPGKRVIHMLDMEPNSTSESEWALKQGWVLFPRFDTVEVYPGLSKTVTTGYWYLNHARLKAHWREISIRVFGRATKLDLKVLKVGMREHPEICPALLQIFNELDIVEHGERSIADKFHRRLEEAARAAGLEIEVSENLTEELIVDSDTLPAFPAGYSGANEVINLNGSVYFERNEAFARTHPGKVRIISKALYFQAKKPGEDTLAGDPRAGDELDTAI